LHAIQKINENKSRLNPVTILQVYKKFLIKKKLNNKKKHSLRKHKNFIYEIFLIGDTGTPWVTVGGTRPIGPWE
jgi:hypothetical protein